MARKQYYFNPFKTRDDKGIQDTQKRYSLKPNCDLVELNTLKYIEDTSTLLIDGHASPKYAVLSSDGTQGTKNQEELQLAELVNLLVGKLPKTHIKIRLLGCYSGVVMAKMLALMLGFNGYDNIVVGGYTESVFTNDDPNGRMFINLDEGVIENTHNSGYVRWFDRKGNPIGKPNVISDPNVYNPAFPTK